MTDIEWSDEDDHVAVIYNETMQPWQQHRMLQSVSDSGQQNVPDALACSTLAADDFEDQTDFDSDFQLASTLADHLRVTLQEIEELPKPAFDFVSKQHHQMIDGFHPDADKQPGPALPQSLTERTELDYFMLFYTPDLLQKICDLTNSHAAVGETTSYGTWKTLQPEELRAFYAIRTFIELFCKDRQESLWQEHTTTKDNFFLLDMPEVSTIFTLRRYRQITKYLHYYEPGSAPCADDTTRDRAYKIRMLVDHIKRLFTKYYNCGEDVVVDECIVPFRGKHGIHQYFKDKPVKWGIKLWMLCDSVSGYCSNFDLYSGRDEDLEDLSNVGVTSAVVIKLCQDIWNSYRTLYTDRYYTSPFLCYYLQQLGMYTCGTTMTNRIGFPKELIAKPKDCNQGEFQWKQCNNTGIVATRWSDKRPIYFLSTCFLPECDNCTVTCYDKRGNELTVAATPAVVQYNKMMGGVDINDKMAKLDKSRKTYRWYSRIDRKMIMLSMANAYVLCKESTGKAVELRTFMLKVIHQLLGNSKFRQPKSGRRSTRAVINDTRLVDTAHFPVKGVGSDHRCVVCNEKHRRYTDIHGNKVNYNDNPFKACKTTFMCPACDVYLCTGKSCYADYHSKEKYWE